MLLSLVLPHIRTPFYRKLYNTALGPLLTLYTYGLGITIIIPYNLVGYLCMALAPRKQAHLYVIVINGLWLTANNIIRMLQEDLGYGVITLCMLCYVKQTIISMNYRDGAYADKELTAREKKYALTQLPNFFDYCTYVFNLQSAVVGPSFEFKDWDNFINLQGDYAKMKPFSNYWPALKRFAQGLFCIVVSVLCFQYCPPDSMLSREFGQQSIAYKYVHLYFS